MKDTRIGGDQIRKLGREGRKDQRKLIEGNPSDEGNLGAIPQLNLILVSVI